MCRCRRRGARPAWGSRPMGESGGGPALGGSFSVGLDVLLAGQQGLQILGQARKWDGSSKHFVRPFGVLVVEQPWIWHFRLDSAKRKTTAAGGVARTASANLHRRGRQRKSRPNPREITNAGKVNIAKPKNSTGPLLGGDYRKLGGSSHWNCPLLELLVCQGFDAGEFLAFEEFEAGAAAGADVRDLVGEAGFVDGAY